MLEIDGKNRAVRVVHNSVEKLMTFQTDGITNSTPVVVAGGPGAPGIPVPGQPAGGRGAGAMPVPGGVNAINRGTPTPTPILPGALAPSSTATPAVRSIPSRTVRTRSGASVPNPQQDTFTPIQRQPDMDPNEQILLLEAQRLQNPGLPPTPGLPQPFPQ